MEDERNNPAEAGIADVRDDAPLSVDDAAARLSSIEGDEPEAKAEPATEATTEGKDGQGPDPDDWDSPATEGEQEGAPEGAEKAEDQPSESGRFVGLDAKVKLDDGRVVTVGELRSGSMMQADYTRKTQELAEQRRSVEARQAEIEQLTQHVALQRELVATLASQVAPPMPDPQTMHADPIGYLQAKEAHERFQAQLYQLAQGHQQEAEHRQKQVEAAITTHIAQEAENLMKAMPELRDPAKRAKWSAELEQTAKHYGFDGNDIAAVKDHRLFLLVTDAMRYRRMVKNRAEAGEKAKGKPPVVMDTGRRVSAQANAAKERGELMKRVRQSGSVEDAARALNALDL